MNKSNLKTDENITVTINSSANISVQLTSTMPSSISMVDKVVNKANNTPQIKEPTQEEIKIAISQMIDVLWGKNTFGDNTPDNINPEVVKILNIVINEIKKCSSKLVTIEPIFSFLYSVPNFFVLTEFTISIAISAGASAIADLIKTGNPLDTYLSWIKIVMNTKEYQTCVKTVVWRYKTPMALALVNDDFFS